VKKGNIMSKENKCEILFLGTAACDYPLRFEGEYEGRFLKNVRRSS